MTNSFRLGLTACGGLLAGWIAIGCSSDDNKTAPGGTGGTSQDGGSGGSNGGKGGKGGSGGSSGAGGGQTGGGGGVGGSDAGDGGTPFSIASSYCATNSLAQAACGEYIVRHVSACGDCHSPIGAQGPQLDPDHYLTGNTTLFDLDPTDAAKGGVYPPNLTLLNGDGWTAADIKDAFLNGKRTAARGGGLFPIMPYYVFHNMAADDADAVAAFILSLPAKGTQVPARQPLPAPFDQAPLPVPAVDVAGAPKPAAGANLAAAERGRYIATSVAPCMECHTERTPQGMLDPAKYFAGGETFPVGGPFGTVTSLNITPAANGIAGWAAADVQKLILQGVDKDGTPICPPMPAGPFGAFGGMDPGEALDIGHYLTTIPGTSNPEDGGRFHMCVPPAPPSDAGLDSGPMPTDASTKG